MSDGKELAFRMIEFFEGDELKPYQDIRGRWTYGYGMTTALDGTTVDADTPPLTQAQAVAALDDAIERIWAFLIAGIPNDYLSDYQDAALCSFIYNVGQSAFTNSTMHRLLVSPTAENEQRMAALASEQFPLWCHAGNKISTPLLHRRAIERAVFNGLDFDQSVLLVKQVTNPAPLETLTMTAANGAPVVVS